MNKILVIIMAVVAMSMTAKAYAPKPDRHDTAEVKKEDSLKDRVIFPSLMLNEGGPGFGINFFIRDPDFPMYIGFEGFERDPIGLEIGFRWRLGKKKIVNILTGLSDNYHTKSSVFDESTVKNTFKGEREVDTRLNFSIQITPYKGLFFGAGIHAGLRFPIVSSNGNYDTKYDLHLPLLALNAGYSFGGKGK